jgi:hypothetical protein
LLSLLANNPDFFEGQEVRIERLAESTRKLMQSAGYWRNTQENVFCAKALLDHDRYFNRERPDLNIRVSARDFSGDVTLRDARRANPEPVTVKLDPGPPGDVTDVFLSAAGSGRGYYTARLGFARDMHKTPAESQGFSIRRSYKISCYSAANWCV